MKNRRGPERVNLRGWRAERHAQERRAFFLLRHSQNGTVDDVGMRALINCSTIFLFLFSLPLVLYCSAIISVGLGVVVAVRCIIEGRSVSLCSQLCVLTSSMLLRINKPWIQCLFSCVDLFLDKTSSPRCSTKLRFRRWSVFFS